MIFIATNIFAQSSTAIDCKVKNKEINSNIHIDAIGKGFFRSSKIDEKEILECEVIIFKAQNNFKDLIQNLELKFELANCKMNKKSIVSKKKSPLFNLKIDFSDAQEPVATLNNSLELKPMRCEISKLSKLSLILFIERFDSKSKIQ